MLSNKKCLLAICLLFNVTFFAKALINESSKDLSNSNVSFTENKGQVYDQNFKTNSEVLYSGSDGLLAFFLKDNGISYQQYRVDSYKKEENVKTNTVNDIPDLTTIYRIDITWINAQKNTIKKPSDPLGGYNNYYLENCPNGVLNVRSYEQVIYSQIYPGIDIKWYQQGGHLKYDYLISSGADYKLIQLSVKGADKIYIGKDGQLIIKTPLGEIIEEAPVVIQNNRELKSKWIIRNDIVSFEIDNLNSNQPFTIDPAVRTWGTYYGGGNLMRAYATTTDSLNNVYLAGASDGGGPVATVGASQNVFGGAADAYVAKFDQFGNRLWATHYGGSAYDAGYSCVTGTGNNVFLLGLTNSSTAISTIGGHQEIYGGSGDGFLVKFNDLGVRQWGTYYGGAAVDYAFSVSTDANGNSFFTGYSATSTGTIIATLGSHQPSFGGGVDAYLVKFNSSGVRQWATYYGGDGNNCGKGCATDASGNVFVAGYTFQNTIENLSTVGSYQPSFGGGGKDGFLVKFNNSGVRQWGTYFGDFGYEDVEACATDGNGDIYLVGTTDTNAVGVISDISSHQPNFGGIADGFLVKFSNSGNRIWGTYYGGAITDNVYSCATDIDGNVYITGDTGSGNNIASSNGHQPIYAQGIGYTDAFLAKFNSSGVRQWGTYYGDTQFDYGQSCIADKIGNVYMSGFTASNTGTVIATSGSHQPNFYPGIENGFLVQFYEPLVTKIDNHDVHNEFINDLFPNPTSDVLNLEIQNSKHQNVNIEILSAIGQRVFTDRFIENNIQLNVKDLSNGIYFLKVELDGKFIVSKFIKK